MGQASNRNMLIFGVSSLQSLAFKRKGRMYIDNSLFWTCFRQVDLVDF